MKQALIQNLCCTVSAAVGAYRVFRQHRQSGMKIHPAPIGQAEALVELTALQRFPRLIITAVTHEQRGDVGVHMGGAGLNTGHALLVGQLFAGIIDRLGEMGDAEQIHILEAFGLPELCLFGEDVLFRRGIEVHGSSQRLLLLLATGDIKLALIMVHSRSTASSRVMRRPPLALSS